MDASEVKRLRELENGKLKRMLTDAHLDVRALKKRLRHKTRRSCVIPTAVAGVTRQERSPHGY